MLVMNDPSQLFANPTRCPNCGEMLRGATNALGNEPPEPGAVTVCVLCGSAAMFQKDLSFRLLTPDDYRQFTPEEVRQLTTIISMVKAVIASQKHNMN